MSEETKTTTHQRVLSGMRPTGKLHLGNYMGALKNWVDLQNATNDDGTQKYECYFFIADYHALTTDYADTDQLRQNVREVALDFLAAGLDRKKCTIFLQSEVQAHFVLNSLLEMITPLSWLERVPTYKDQQEQLKDTQNQVAQARSDLEGSLGSTRDELNGSIAKTHDELVALEQKGERSYVEFDLVKAKHFQRHGVILVAGLVQDGFQVFSIRIRDHML